MAEQFKEFIIPIPGSLVCELRDQQAHLFLEKRREASTVTALREALRKIDIDNNGTISFIEYCLYHYNLSLIQLFETKESHISSLREELDSAIT